MLATHNIAWKSVHKRAMTKSQKYLQNMANICQKSAYLLNIRSIQIDICIISVKPANVDGTLARKLYVLVR